MRSRSSRGRKEKSGDCSCGWHFASVVSVSSDSMVTALPTSLAIDSVMLFSSGVSDAIGAEDVGLRRPRMNR